MTTDKPTTPPGSNAPADTEATSPSSGEAQTPASPPDPNAAKPGNTAPADDGYKVGYGCPPKDTQFKKGQPSPRKGKKFNKQNHDDLFWKTLNEKVSVKIGGKIVRMTRHEACLRKHAELALSGDSRALKEVLRLYSIMSAAKRGEEVRAAQREQRELLYAMLAEQEEKERQEDEARKAKEQETAEAKKAEQKAAAQPKADAKPAAAPAQTPPAGSSTTDASANKKWRP